MNKVAYSLAPLIGLVLAFLILAFAIGPLLIMAVWNWGLAAAIPILPQINYWAAFWLNVGLWFLKAPGLNGLTEPKDGPTEFRQRVAT